MSFSFTWRGDEVARNAHQAAQVALEKVANDLQQESSEEAPVMVGDLRGNAGIDLSRLAELIVFVGYNLLYAWVQHEGLDFFHPLGGKAKFLEDPFNRKRKIYFRFIGEEIGKNLL